MNAATDFTKVMQDMMAKFPVDASAFQNAFKTQAAFGEKLSKVALEAAAAIASFSRPVVSLAKQVVDLALETPLTQGIRSERQMFKSTFALEDQKEGMAAFVEKRPAEFSNR